MKFDDTGLQTVMDYFYHWENTRPEAVFLRQPYGEQYHSVTWAEAGETARRMAAALRSLGLQPGDHIGIVSKNCYHWILADLAIMMGGYVSVPFYPNLTADQLGEVLSLSDARALFVGKLDDWESMRGGIPEDLQIIRFPHYPGNAEVREGLHWDELTAAHEPVDESRRPALDDLWTILFTSGTTGSPKGVMHTYYAPAALMENERRHNDLQIFSGTDHRFFSFLPLNHIAERVIVEMACILTGGTITFAESLDTFARNLQDTQPTLFMAVPRIWTKFQLAILERMPQRRLSLLLRLPVIGNLLRRKIRKGLGLDQARIMLTGAAPTPDTLKEWYRQFDLKLQEVYAMTENCGGCTLMPISNLRPGTVGKALPHVEVRTDPQTGEVIMRAPWLMQGYYNDSEKTAEVLRDGWLYTGDQGAVDEDGFLRLTGRVSDTFKSAKGKFIVPAPIEWGFAKNSFIEQVCVVGLAIPQPLALIILSEIGRTAPQPEVEESLQRSLEKVNSSLSAYQRLKGIVVMAGDWTVENECLTPTLKIRRDELNRRYQAHFQQWYDQPREIIWEGTEATAGKKNL